MEEVEERVEKRLRVAKEGVVLKAVALAGDGRAARRDLMLFMVWSNGLCE